MPMAVMIGLMAAGTMMQVKGQQDAAAAQQQAGEYNAQIDEANAAEAKDQAAQEEQITREKYARVMATQRANYGAAGVEISSGSPLAVLQDQAYQAERDALNVRWKGAVNYDKFMNQANLERFYGATAVNTANTQGVATILKGAGSIMQSYYGPQVTKAGLKAGVSSGTGNG
jgi:hypothetical protein